VTSSLALHPTAALHTLVGIGLIVAFNPYDPGFPCRVHVPLVIILCLLQPGIVLSRSFVILHNSSFVYSPTSKSSAMFFG